MFGASRFEEMACRTGDPWVKQPSVIWVDVQLARDFLLCYCACQDERVKKQLLYFKQPVINMLQYTAAKLTWISLYAEVEEQHLDA